MADLKWFEAAVSVEEGRRLWLQAESEEQAELIIDMLIDYGELPEVESHRDIVHRDIYVVEVEQKDRQVPAKTYSEIDKKLARLAFLLVEQVNGEYSMCHDPRAMPELRDALLVTLSALELRGIDVRGDEISIINEGR